MSCPTAAACVAFGVKTDRQTLGQPYEIRSSDGGATIWGHTHLRWTPTERRANRLETAPDRGSSHTGRTPAGKLHAMETGAPGPALTVGLAMAADLLSWRRTDVDGRSEVAGVYAAGDAAAAFDPLLGRHVVGGHWETAARQGARAARAMLGLDPGPLALSSFWSDLYGTRVQYLGHASLGVEVTLDGDPQAREFTATFTRQEQAVAVLLVGRPQMLPQARELLSATTEMAFA